MKKAYGLAILGGILAVGVIIFLAVQQFAGNQLREASADNPCGEPGNLHVVTISDDTFQPDYVSAKRCDQMTIQNTDSQLRKIAFGKHNKHQPYNGITEKLLHKGEGLTITLDQTGSYTLHDHLNEKVKGNFTVE